jgi:hypothetical protein
MGFCCIGRRRRRAKEDEAAEAATRAWCQEAVSANVPQTPAASRALETRTPLHARAVVRPSPLEVELGASTRGPAPVAPAARRVVGLDAARRRPAASRGDGRLPASASAPDAARPASSGDGRLPVGAAPGPGRPAPQLAATPDAERPTKPQPEITPAARRTVDLDAAAAFAATPPPPRMRTPLADANGTVLSGKRRPYRGLSTPALVADLERTLGTRLRPRHATVQKARRGNGDGYEGWLRRHFASPPRRRRSKTSPPEVWI